MGIGVSSNRAAAGAVRRAAGAGGVLGSPRAATSKQYAPCMDRRHLITVHKVHENRQQGCGLAGLPQNMQLRNTRPKYLQLLSFWGGHGSGDMSRAATTWAPMGTQVPVLSPNDHPNPCQGRQKGLGKTPLFESFPCCHSRAREMWGHYPALVCKNGTTAPGRMQIISP